MAVGISISLSVVSNDCWIPFCMVDPGWLYLMPALGFSYCSNWIWTDYAIGLKRLRGHWPAELSWDEIFGTLTARYRVSHSRSMNLASAAQWEVSGYNQIGWVCSAEREPVEVADGLVFQMAPFWFTPAEPSVWFLLGQRELFQCLQGYQSRMVV